MELVALKMLAGLWDVSGPHYGKKPKFDEVKHTDFTGEYTDVNCVTKCLTPSPI